MPKRINLGFFAKNTVPKRLVAFRKLPYQLFKMAAVLQRPKVALPTFFTVISPVLSSINTRYRAKNGGSKDLI